MADDFSENKPSRETHEFNMAFSYLGRLNMFLWECREAAHTFDGNRWLQALSSITMELSTDMKEEERTRTILTLKTLFNEVNTNVNRAARLPNIGIEPPLYWKLYDLELFLRNIMKEAGMISKMKDDPFNSLR